MSREPVSGNPALRALVHAAFHVIDDSEEDAQTGRVSIDNDIAANDLRRMADALNALGIEEHDDIDKVFCARQAVAVPDVTEEMVKAFVGEVAVSQTGKIYRLKEGLRAAMLAAAKGATC